MTKERSILFSTPMVQAILDGSKTQTRRTRGLKEINENPENWKEGPVMQTCRFWDADKEEDPNPLEVHYSFFHKKTGEEFKLKCPYGKPGDLLYVRENFKIVPPNQVYFQADLENKATNGWRPSIYMPKDAARIWLEITDISVERLQDISKEDAIAEGIEPVADGYKNYMPKLSSTSQFFWPTAYHSFQSLWESINGAESWEMNPWLWVVKFKVLSTNGKEEQS